MQQLFTKQLVGNTRLPWKVGFWLTNILHAEDMPVSLSRILTYRQKSLNEVTFCKRILLPGILLATGCDAKMLQHFSEREQHSLFYNLAVHPSSSSGEVKLFDVYHSMHRVPIQVNGVSCVLPSSHFFVQSQACPNIPARSRAVTPSEILAFQGFPEWQILELSSGKYTWNQVVDLAGNSFHAMSFGALWLLLVASAGF